MESSTELSQEEQKMIARWQEPDWETMTKGIPADLESTARKMGALIRGRQVRSATTYLRLVMAYSVCDWSLRQVGAWAAIQKIANISDVGLLYRFRQSNRWLGWLLVSVLKQRNEYLKQLDGVRVRLLDATVITRPGSTGTDWRVHVSFDLGQMLLDGIEITTALGGESLSRFPPRSDEIAIGDRAYGVSGGLGSLLAGEGRCVVRINWHNLPLKTDLGQRLDLIDWLTGLTKTTERSVLLPTPQGEYPVRLVACMLPPAEAQQARERIRKRAAKKGKKVNPDTWLAAGFVVLITNLPEDTWEASRIIWLYRLRWQIELLFKRLKSLLQIDHLRAQDPRLVQTYLLGKFLAALLLDQLGLQVEKQNQNLFNSLQRPVSLWRLQSLLWLGIHDLIVGHFSLYKILSVLPGLQRYLCDAPRTRIQQLAWARRFLARLSAI